MPSVARSPRSRPAAVAVVRRLRTRRRWGATRVQVSRPDRTDLQLVLFDPDTTEVERAWLRVWRAWPLAGVLPAAVTFAAIGSGGGLVVGSSAAAILYAVGFGIAAQQTPGRGDRLIMLRGGLERRDGFDQHDGDVDRIMVWAGRLQAADDAWEAGEVGEADRDAAWREAWEALTS